MLISDLALSLYCKHLKKKKMVYCFLLLMIQRWEQSVISKFIFFLIRLTFWTFSAGGASSWRCTPSPSFSPASSSQGSPPLASSTSRKYFPAFYPSQSFSPALSSQGSPPWASLTSRKFYPASYPSLFYSFTGLTALGFLNFT